MNILDIVPNHIRQIEPYIAGRPIEDVERDLCCQVAKLEANENALGPSPKALDAMRQYLQKVHRYPDDLACHLRQRLSEHLDMPMDEIIIGAGSSDIFAMAFQAVLTPGSEVVTSHGSFIVYYLLAEAAGARLIATPMNDFRFDLPAMAERISTRTRLVCIANPNNPTGTIVRRQELREFMKQVPEHVLVILDEAYFEYVDDPEYPDSLEHLREGRPILLTRTFSKAYGLAGVRIGYGIAAKSIIEVLHKVRMTFNVSSIAQVAALAALEDRDHVEKSVKLNRAELEFLYRELTVRGVRYVASQANFLMLEAGNAKELESRMLKEGVMVRAMARSFPAMIRVTVGTRDQNEAFLRAFDKTRL